MGWGALGGALVEFLDFSRQVLAWQKRRQQCLDAGAYPLPRLRATVDIFAHVGAGLIRVILGTVAGFLVHGEVTGIPAAVAVGLSAPAILRGLSGTALPDRLQQARTEGEHLLAAGVPPLVQGGGHDQSA